MQHKLVDYNNFELFRKSTAMALSLWARAFQKQYNQLTDEWTTQLIDYQLKAIHTFEPGEFREQRITAFTGFQALILWPPNTADRCNEPYREEA